MNSEKLRIKEVITVTLLSLVNIVIFSIGAFLYLTPITVLLMPVFYAFFQGIVFFIIGVKVKKKGAVLLYCAIQGVIGFYIPYIVLYIVAGIISEIILAKTDYADPRGLTISYVIIQVCACVGSTIYPYAVALNATLDGMKNTGNLNTNIAQAGVMLQSWGTAILAVGVIVAAFIGAWMGNRVIKRHILSGQ